MDEGQVYQSSSQLLYVYDELFPALPESANPPPVSDLGKWNNKMRIGSSVITQVFRVPAEERRYDHNDSFGEKDSLRTCSQIMKETGALIEISSSKDQSLTFLVTGKQDNVMEARRRILNIFQTQASQRLTIPKEHHRLILGKAGVRLKEIEKMTSTKIQVPLMNDMSEEITVVGTKDGVDKAIHEIQVISDEQSKKAFERISIPKVYHPFLSGAYGENVNALMASTGTRIHIPPPSAQVDEITIAGEKEGVAVARDKLLSMYQSMKDKYTTVCVEVIKNQHKYVIGPKGTGIAEILQSTGVSVEMPPLDLRKETITLRGPQDKLGSALNMVYSKANSVEAVMVTAPSWIHKYIIGRKGANIKQITQDLSKVHVQFTEKEDKITIEGPPEEVEQARNKLNELTAEMVNKLTYTTLTVDPKYYKHIIGKNGANVNRLKEQTGVVINISDTEQNVIRIEGDKNGVAQAKQELEDMISKMELEKEKDVIIECKYHRALIGQKGENIREVRDKFSQVQIFFPSPDQKSDIVKLRGVKEEVDKCHKYLLKKVKEIIENSYSIEVPAYGCHKYIIGKGGCNIKKLREETNTTIEMPSEGTKADVITIIGKKENVEKAKEMIMKIQNEQLNIVQEEVAIPPKMYNSLIGAGGKLIRSIEEECGGVSIKFPAPDSKSDKVTLRGPKDDVKKARQLLLEQASERELHSYTAEVRAKPQYHKYLIGKSGANINRIRESTGTRIIFPSDRDEDKELITIMGKQEGVEQAKAELEAAIEKMDNVLESEMVVDQKHHKHFVARRCEVLKQLEDEFAGVAISFPRNGISSDKVTIKGPPQHIEAVKQKINDIIRDLEERVTIVCEIPQKHHRAVMGNKGSKVQEIESRFDVKIKFPDRNARDEQGSYGDGELIDGPSDQLVNGDAGGGPYPWDLIRITGKPKNCEEAAEALRESQPIVVEMDVPLEYHRGIIGPKGQNVRDMMNAFDVYIDVPGPNTQQEFIKITGAPAAVERAKEGILDEMRKIDEEKEDRKLRSFKLTLEVDPDYHPKIIGKRGSVISKIREKHGVQINFPRRGDPDENIITIQGYEDKANSAKEDILAIVNELNELTRDEMEIDARVHSRLIGARGWSIRKIMEKFQVEIKFPRSSDPNPNLVTIIGQEENVLDAKEHLRTLEDEYLDDVEEQEAREARTHPPRLGESNNREGGGGGQGFVVKGAPWEVQVPDTASTQEFPSFGAPASGTPAPSWGPRR
uniref:High density lipoprotein binding protein n=1 Tax=Riptortus pedestris TaxID=329032 RepID=R4WR19_RIPPE|nr:high density lipoprotein binding protein [Riptortus pedestris]